LIMPNTLPIERTSFLAALHPLRLWALYAVHNLHTWIAASSTVLTQSVFDSNLEGGVMAFVQEVAGLLPTQNAVAGATLHAFVVFLTCQKIQNRLWLKFQRFWPALVGLGFPGTGFRVCSLRKMILIRCPLTVAWGNHHAIKIQWRGSQRTSIALGSVPSKW